MAIFWPTPGFNGKTCKLWDLNSWVFNFCVRSNSLAGRKRTNGCLQVKDHRHFSSQERECFLFLAEEDNQRLNRLVKLISFSELPRSICNPFPFTCTVLVVVVFVVSTVLLYRVLFYCTTCSYFSSSSPLSPSSLPSFVFLSSFLCFFLPTVKGLV